VAAICCVVGARPNFMKMAPVILEAQRRGLVQVLVHTGQHYDAQMSEIFFVDLGMPRPDIHLGVGSGSHASQTGHIMMAFEKVCLELQPHLVVVGGDVNSTLACALVAAKLQIPVAHVEAGLRSFDRSMPEEINRLLTDHIASLLFTTEASATENLLREGIPCECIHFVGNPMIDSLRLHLDKALARRPWQQFALRPGGYGLVTLHRPANVDNADALHEICATLREVADDIPLLFPVHPRTRQRIEQLRLDWHPVKLADPLGYLDFLGLMARARLVLTDSGGIQEETTALGVPCVTLRPNTERPITVKLGTNRLAGVRRPDILAAVGLATAPESGASLPLPPLWDGRAAYRIVDVIERWLHR
jgi:UDP-N-acetylglucosamine 2-epimerase (non-hydrolysing)